MCIPPIVNGQCTSILNYHKLCIDTTCHYDTWYCTVKIADPIYTPCFSNVSWKSMAFSIEIIPRLPIEEINSRSKSE